MSLSEIERAASADEPKGTGTTNIVDGVREDSTDPSAADIHFANLFTTNPDLATILWEDARTQILESDFDPRLAYLQGFTHGMALRGRAQTPEDQAQPDETFDFPRQPDGETLPLPTEPDAEVLKQLGATSLYLASSRAYYRSILES
jgi:hypothetical protein